MKNFLGMIFLISSIFIFTFNTYAINIDTYCEINFTVNQNCFEDLYQLENKYKGRLTENNTILGFYQLKLNQVKSFEELESLKIVMKEENPFIDNINYSYNMIIK